MAESNPPQEQPAIRIIAMPADANYYGDVFGGWLMNMMDLAASSVACRESAGRAATALSISATKSRFMPNSRRWAEPPRKSRSNLGNAISPERRLPK